MKRIDNIMSFWGLVLLLVIGGLAGENVRVAIRLEWSMWPTLRA